MKRIFFAFIVPAMLLVSGTARDAMACAACSCGDPTLVVMGAEQPFAGRLRMALQLTGRSLSMVEPAGGGEDMAEQQIGLAASYSPRRWLTLSAAVPFLRRAWTAQDNGQDGGQDVDMGAGDAELRAKAFVWRDRGFAPRHLLAVQIGALIPLAGAGAAGAADPGGDMPWAIPRHGGSHGEPMDGGADRALASHHPMPLIGASYGYFAGPWSLYASATVHLPVIGTEDPRSLRTTVTGQYQVASTLGVRLGVDTRLDGYAGDGQAAAADPAAGRGGLVAFVSPELLWSPVTDLLLVATLRLPALDRLADQDEGPVLALGAAYDF